MGGSSWGGYLTKGVSVFFEYDTPKIVHIRSISIGIINRVVQFAIIGYILGWVFIYNHGYQQTDIGISGTTTKIKGVAYTDELDSRIGKRLWDASDIVIPAEENNAFFVMTNMITTNQQKQDQCPESDSVADAKCTNDSDCPFRKAYLLGHGVSTGVCNLTTFTCMIDAWCPLENDKLATDYPVLNATKDFTALVKNHVYFPLFGKTRSNILEATNKTYLQTCVYDSDSNPFCPVFKIGDMVEKAHTTNTAGKADPAQTFDDIAYEGGVISIRISWDCNFDYDPKDCKPKYAFDRLDTGEDSKISRGYNFRYSNNYFDGDTEMRQQIKAYGILFIITVDAKAAAFRIIPTFQTIGSGLALLSIATIVCDVFVLYLHKKKVFFREHKYEQVKNTDAYEPMS